MKKIVLFLIVFFSLQAQQNLSIDINHPVYDLLQNAQIRGIINNLSSIKPYSKKLIVNYLKQIGKSHKLTKYEKEIITKYLDYFVDKKEGWQWGNLGYKDNKNNSINFGLNVDSSLKDSLNNYKDYYFHNFINFYVQGDLSKFFSYFLSASINFARVGFNAFGQYDFTKQWDIFSSDVLEPSGTDGKFKKLPTGLKPAFSTNIGIDLSAYFFENEKNHNIDQLGVRVMRYRRDYGSNLASLTLSKTARPFLGVELMYRPIKEVAFTHMFGSLDNWQKEDRDTDITHQKLFNMQKLEYYPISQLYFSLSGAVVSSKKFELGYLVPMLYSMMYQNVIGDWDNVALEFEVFGIIPYVGKIGLSLFADEFAFSSIYYNVTEMPRSQVAFSVFFQFPIPKAPFSNFNFQYTYISPFTYTHYPTLYPSSRLPVDTSWNHDNENLGYNLPPNSDEFLFSFFVYATSKIFLKTTYKFIRHGDSYRPQNEPYLHGDINKYIDYGYVENGNYPAKSIGKNGIYDYTHTLSFDFNYEFFDIPIIINLNYTFTYTHYDNDLKPSKINNILGLNLKFFFRY